jgi:hypothetical protein
MILTAMVVSMGLPLPSVDSCRSLVNEMNREMTAALSDVGSEFLTKTLEGSQILAVEETSGQETTQAHQAQSHDGAFAQILDEFANEAVRPEIEQVAADLRRIPVEPVTHELPPAVEAIDLLPSAADLIRSVSEERIAHPVDSISTEWNEVVAGRCGEPEFVPESIDMVHPVQSTDIGAWETVLNISDFEFEPIAETTRIAIGEETVVAPIDSDSSEWAAVMGEYSVATAEAEITPADEQKDATIRDAFRKTAEAIALWSKVMTRPF